jgi:hydroxyacylglutathione hydrolase
MFVKQFYEPNLAIYSYLIGDSLSKKCAVIDPHRLITPVVEFIQEDQWDVTHILETHVHADFVSGSRELKHHLGGRPLICCSPLGDKTWYPSYADQAVQEGDEIRLGSHLRLQAKHTPGHTPEHIIWLGFDESRDIEVPRLAFTGDLLFVGGVGRPDLLGESQFEFLAKELYDSLFTRLASLPDSIEILPAHGAGSLCGKSMSTKSTSTLGHERQFNPSLQPRPQEQWIQELQKNMPTAPASFSRIKRINVEGPVLMSENYHSLIHLLSYQLTNTFSIDVRDPLSFAEKHMKNTINIPMGQQFCNWAGMIVPADFPLTFILPDSQMTEPLAQLLWLVGFEKIVGYRLWEEIIQDPEVDLESLPSIPPSRVLEEPYLVIDVRSPAEWESGHIPNARHIELSKLLQAIPEIPKDQPIATTCGSGYRGSIAASLLRKGGFSHVANIQGGMQAWEQAHLPVIKGF